MMKNAAVGGVIWPGFPIIGDWIMKIPNTLHGTTGFVAKNIVDVENFEVLKEALVFDKTDYPKFKIDWNKYL